MKIIAALCFFLAPAIVLSPAFSADAPEGQRKLDVVTVLVGGAVNKFGKYELKKGALVSDAIARAGGITRFGQLTKVKLTRVENAERRTYALNLSEKGRPADNMELRDDDIVFVPEPIG